MIALITFVEWRRMEGQKRPRESGAAGGSMNFVDDEERRRGSSGSSNNNNALVGIRSEILKEEGGGAPGTGDYCYAADVPPEDGIRQQQQHGSSKNLKDFQDGVAGYGHLLGPVSSMGAEYRRLAQWNSESLSSDYPEKYKRLAAAAAAAAAAPAGETGLEERRVRSRPEASVLSNLLGRRDDQTELHMNISARTLRPSGGKDRHSKVFTAKGPRDRRVRLSVSTAIQFYDVQDRLGYDQPSKAVEWLMKKAKNAIDELSQIPLPGIDRLALPSSSYSHPYGFASPTLSPAGSAAGHDQGGGGHFSSFASSCDMQLKGVGVLPQQSSLVVREGQSPELKACSSSARDQQAVEEGDTFPRQRREELEADITMSVGEGGSARRSGGAPHYHHHHHHHSMSLGTFNPESCTSEQCQMQEHHQQQHRDRDWKSLLHPGSSSYTLYDDSLDHHSLQQQQQQHHHHQQRLQELFQTPPVHFRHQQQQTSLIAVQQTYLQQQDFLHGSNVLPFTAATSAAAAASPGTPGQKPALDQFHSLKIAAGSPAALAATAAAEKPSSNDISSTALRFPSSFLRSPVTSSNPGELFSPKIQQQQHQQQQQQVPPSLQFESSAQEFPTKFQCLEDRKRRD